MNDPMAISEFWAWFSEHDADLSAMPDADAPFWDTALSRLRVVDPGLRFEMSDPIGGEREFVITASGNAALFPLVEAMVSAAPVLAGWVFVALKPAMGFDFVTKYEGVTLNPEAMWFLPLQSPERPSDLALRIGIPGLNDDMRRVAGKALFMILDTGLGERSAALDVQHVEFTALPNEPEEAGYIELPELAKYIGWCKRRAAKA